MLDRANEIRSLKQRIMGAGIEPGIAAAELDDMKLLKFQVAPVDVGDFKLAAGRGTQVGGNVEHRVVIEIKPGDRPIGDEVGWLFDDVDERLHFHRTSQRRTGSAR